MKVCTSNSSIIQSVIAINVISITNVTFLNQARRLQASGFLQLFLFQMSVCVRVCVYGHP